MLIGLIGNKRVGKDTVANFLVEGFQFKKLAFADPIKEVISLLFDLDISEEVGISLEESKKIIDFSTSFTEPFKLNYEELKKEILSFLIINMFTLIYRL